jgi:hypothetical protein
MLGLRPGAAVATVEVLRKPGSHSGLWPGAAPAHRQWLFREVIRMGNGMDYHAARRVAGLEPME